MPHAASVSRPPSRSPDSWVEALEESKLPVLARTAREVGTVTGREDASVAELAAVVLRDAPLTARVLHVANSSYYNPASTPISTVSRAVVVLGFEAVRSICLSAAVVKSLSDAPPAGRVLEELARAVHAAVQAKALEGARGGARGEEVFIAALLHRIGPMVFWWGGGEAAQELARALEERDGEDPAEVERSVLGFSLDRLTAALSRSWRLGPLVEEALSHRPADPAARIARGSHALVEAIGRGGWASPEAQMALRELARSAGLELEEVVRVARESERHAEETARALGGEPLAAALTARAGGKAPPAHEERKGAPAPGPSFPSVHAHGGGEGAPAGWSAPEPDPMLQLRILRELAALLDERPNVVLMLEMVLEGLHRGVGMDRALFALLSPDRRLLRAKHAIGAETETLRRAFRFPLSEPNAIVSVLEGGRAVLVDPAEGENLGLTPEVLAVTGGCPFCAAPLRVGRRAIGLLYADRRPSGRPIDAESFASFRQFGQQANLGLAALELHRASP